MAADSSAPAAAPAAPATKPVQPDQKAYQEKLAQLEKEHQAALSKYVSAAKLKAACPSRARGPAAAFRRVG